MKTLAIIPARAGSKGVKDKNLRSLKGKPLISYTIECAKESKRINEIIISTDHPEIAMLAESSGVKVIHRPAELAEDHSPITDVIEHTLIELKKQDKEFDIVLLLQPTAPFRTSDDIDTVIEMFGDPDSPEGVVSVVQLSDVHPARMYKMNREQHLTSFLPEFENARRQELPPLYFRNGCIYAARTNAFIKEGTLMVKNMKAYIMPAEWLVNIDSERDLLIAESIYDLWMKQE